MLLRFPTLCAAVAAAAVVVGVGAATGPLFLGSAGAEIARAEVGSAVDPAVWTASIRAQAGVEGLTSAVNAADVEVREALDRIGDVDAPVLTIAASSVTALPDTADAVRARLLARGGATAQVELLEGGREGLLVPDTMPGGPALGASLTVSRGDATADLPVTGVYRDLRATPLSDYWRQAGEHVPDPANYDDTPPPVLLAEPGILLDALEDLADEPIVAWHAGLSGVPTTLADLETVTARATQVVREAATADQPLGAALGRLSGSPDGVEAASDLPALTSGAQRILAALVGPVAVVAVAAGGAGFAVVAGAARFTARARSGELRLRGAQGVAPGLQGLHAVVEAIPPVSFGAWIGWLSARALVRRAGPGAALEPGSAAAAGVIVVAVALAAIVVFGVVTALTARQASTHIDGSRAGRWSRLPWEAVPLTLAAAAYYQIILRGQPVAVEGGRAQLDSLVVAFPMLALFGCAGLVARAAQALLPAMGRVGGAHRTARYLAVRRLATAPRITSGVIALTVAAVGILTYATGVAATTRAALDAKGLARTGAPVVADLGVVAEAGHIAALGEALDGPHTLVRRTRAQPQTGQVAPDVLAVDPDELAAVTGSALLGPEPDRVLTELAAGGGRLPAVLVGGEVRDLRLSGTDVPIAPIARLDAFPGLGASPMVVVAWEHLAPLVARADGTEPLVGWTRQVWADTTPEQVAQAAATADVSLRRITESGEVLRATGVTASTWTLGFLEALGASTALLSMAGLALFLRARQDQRRIAHLLLDRIGVSAATERTAIVLEVTAVLAIGALIGTALGVLGAAAVVGPLDPLPRLAPSARLVLPTGPLLVVAAAVPVVAVVVGAWMQRHLRRLDPARIVRMAQ